MAGPAGRKLFYKIGEVGRIAGVESYILRYWQGEFPQLAPRKNRGGQRVYLQKDLDLVLRIKKMLYEEGFTIAGAKKRLAEPGHIVGGGAEIARPAEELPGPRLAKKYALQSPTLSQDNDAAAALSKVREEIRGILEIIK